MICGNMQQQQTYGHGYLDQAQQTKMEYTE